MSLMQTSYPSLAKRSAMALPMPREEPVTMAVRFEVSEEGVEMALRLCEVEKGALRGKWERQGLAEGRRRKVRLEVAIAEYHVSRWRSSCR